MILYIIDIIVAIILIILIFCLCFIFRTPKKRGGDVVNTMTGEMKKRK
jgi:hypothetical protein